MTGQAARAHTILVVVAKQAATEEVKFRASPQDVKGMDELTQIAFDLEVTEAPTRAALIRFGLNLARQAVHARYLEVRDALEVQ